MKNKVNGSTVFNGVDRFVVITNILTFNCKVARDSAAPSSYVLSRRALIQKRRRYSDKAPFRENLHKNEIPVFGSEGVKGRKGPIVECAQCFKITLLNHSPK